MGNKGQGATEALLALPLMIATFLLIGKLSYHSGLYLFASYHSEEALLCSARISSSHQCEINFKKKLSQLLLFKEEVTVKIQRRSDQTNLQVKIDDIKFERALKLPLERNLP